MTILSIIIVSYNTKQLLCECLDSLYINNKLKLESGAYEVIIVDNASIDGSVTKLKQYKNKIKKLLIIENKENFGFSKANNIGIQQANGKYFLFLNSDTIIYPDTLSVMITFMEQNEDAGAATCRVLTLNNNIDEGSHRGFPTPWTAFCHFSGLGKILPRSRLFAGYTQGWKDFDKIHVVDAIVGAFMLVKREAGDKIGWWDEDYFFYGEDLDFCYKLHQKGYSIYYVPTVKILHYGGVSSGIKKQSNKITTANIKTQILIQNARFNAMRIFYNKHYKYKYPWIITYCVLQGIRLKEHITISLLKK